MEQADDLTEDLLHCNICLEGFKDPKVLRCQHTFCRACLESYWPLHRQPSRSRHHGQMLPCPTCRHMTTLPRNGMSGLPSDFKVSKIEDLVQRLASREERYNCNDSTMTLSTAAMTMDAGRIMRCDICVSIHRDSAADYYCRDCEKHLCEVCTSRHSEVLLFKQHAVVHVDKRVATQRGHDDACVRHPAERMKYLCSACSVPACTVCVMEAHSNHDVTDLNRGVRRLKQKLGEVIDKVGPIMTKSKETVVSLRALVDAQKDHFDRATAVIKARTQDIIKQAKQCERELLKVVQEHHTKSLHEAENQLHNILGKSEEYDRNYRDLQKGLQENNVLLFLRDFQSLENTAVQLLEKTLRDEPNNPKVLVKFLPSSEPIKHGTLQYTNLSIAKDVSNEINEQAVNEVALEQTGNPRKNRDEERTYFDIPERDTDITQTKSRTLNTGKKTPTTDYKTQDAEHTQTRKTDYQKKEFDKVVDTPKSPPSYQPVKVVRSVTGINRNTHVRSSYRIDNPLLSLAKQQTSPLDSEKTIHLSKQVKQPELHSPSNLLAQTRDKTHEREAVRSDKFYTQQQQQKASSTHSSEPSSSDDGYATSSTHPSLNNPSAGLDNIEITATFPVYKQTFHSVDNLDPAGRDHKTDDATTKRKTDSKPISDFRREVKISPKSNPLYKDERRAIETTGLNLSAGPPPYSRHNPHISSVKAPPVPSKPRDYYKQSSRTVGTAAGHNGKENSGSRTHSSLASPRERERTSLATNTGLLRTNTAHVHNISYSSEESSCSNLSQDSGNAANSPTMIRNMQQHSPSYHKMLVQKPQILARLNKSELPVNFPPAIAFLPNGQIVLAEMMTCKIGLYSKKLKFVRLISHGKFQPTYVTVMRDNNLALIDAGEVGYCVKIINLSGECLAEWGHGMFRYPSSIVCTKENILVIADAEERTICLRKPDSRLVGQFVVSDDAPKTSATSANNSIGVALDNHDNIVVSDNRNNCVKVFSQKGDPLMHFGSRGKLDGQFLGSLDASVDMNGNFIVADMCGKRISMFSPGGKFVKHLVEDNGDPDASCVPECLWIYQDGTLVVIHSPAQWQYEVLVYQIYE